MSVSSDINLGAHSSDSSATKQIIVKQRSSAQRTLVGQPSNLIPGLSDCQI